MFHYFAHAGHDHSGETPEPSEITYQTAAVAHDTPATTHQSDFSATPFIIGGVLAVVLAAVIVAIVALPGKNKATKRSHSK